MKLTLVVIALATSVTVTPVMGGERVKLCHDEFGNPYFTDTSCLANGAAEGRVYVPNAQGYTRRFSGAEVQMLIDHERRNIRTGPTRNAPPNAPSYSDELAARNAMVGIRAERDMYRHRRHGPKDAAEMAIEYNADVIANGGSHQVRVPDVTNVEQHKHEYKTEHHYHYEGRR